LAVCTELTVLEKEKVPPAWEEFAKWAQENWPWLVGAGVAVAVAGIFGWATVEASKAKMGLAEYLVKTFEKYIPPPKR